MTVSFSEACSGGVARFSIVVKGHELGVRLRYETVNLAGSDSLLVGQNVSSNPSQEKRPGGFRIIHFPGPLIHELSGRVRGISS